MAIQLYAEQKTTEKVFFNKDCYVIPEFQRPYSWGQEQCYQLYTDIVDAMSKDDYFLGNIILARSTVNKENPQVIDGQQRLLTLWILLKVLSVFVGDVYDLDEAFLSIKSIKKGEPVRLKIKSEVIEEKDNDHIEDLYSYDKVMFEKRLEETLNKKGEIKETKCKNHVEYVALFFFQILSQEDIDNAIREQLTEFVLKNVSVLPIELGGDNIEEAKDRALTIFETINNRGLDLCDADIFKAKLYNKALSNHMENDFMSLWQELTEKTNLQDISIDEVFRCYSHIIRGQKGIITAEKKLREFFLYDNISPLTFMDPLDFMNDLLRVVDILDEIKTLRTTDNPSTPWLQILKSYSNNYPQYAIVAFLFKHKSKVHPEEFVDFLKSLIRYSYMIGSTTSVKFGIYSIIQKVMEGLELDKNLKPNFAFADLNYSSRLLNGYALLSYYSEGNSTILNPCIEKIVYASEIQNIIKSSRLKDVKKEDVNTLGNTIVLKSSLRSKSFDERLKSMRLLPTAQNFLESDKYGTLEISKRDKKIKRVIESFFSK